MKDVYVVSSCRTAIGSFGGSLEDTPAAEMGAIVVKEAARAGDMLDCIEKAGGRTLEEARLFDVYRGEKLGEGKKSVAYALTFRASDRTLTDAEIQASMDKILKALETNFGAEIRK